MLWLKGKRVFASAMVCWVSLKVEVARRGKKQPPSLARSQAA